MFSSSVCRSVSMAASGRAVGAVCASSSRASSSVLPSLTRAASSLSTSSRSSSTARLSSNKVALRSSSVAPLSRPFSSTPVARHGELERPEPGTGIKITFKESNGETIKTVEGNEGDDLLSIAHEYDVDLEGACEGSIACSTCHIVLSQEMYDALPEPSDEENDMLDLAFGLTDTSRLGCQVRLSRDVDGLVATLPSATRNMFVDGAKPTKH